MATVGETRNEDEGAAERVQRELTRSVGTSLTRPEKPRGKRLFGRRRKRQGAAS
jgi:hypothetical protein